jgi:S1-C subfamily serine protease
MADEPSRDDTTPRASADRSSDPTTSASPPVPVVPPAPPEPPAPGSEPPPDAGVTDEVSIPPPVFSSHGAVIAPVTTNTRASSAGLQDTDVIVQIGTTAIKDSADVQTATRSHQAGDTVPIAARVARPCRRNGQRPTVG